MTLDYDSDFVDRLLFGEKRCPACEVPKPRNSEHFFVDAKASDGLSGECKPCNLARQQETRRETRVVDNAAAARRGRERYANDPEYRERRKASALRVKAKRRAAA